MWSILIPSWNNLSLLRHCLAYLEKNTIHPYEVIIHVNDGSDGTLTWVRQQGIQHTHSQDNIGICRALNLIAGMAKYPYLVYLNDDMVCLPGWDDPLHSTITSLSSDAFMVSGTLIEPVNSGNPCVLVGDYGRDPDTFREVELLHDLPRMVKSNWYGATWPPTVVHRSWWDRVGGYSEEFSPGMSSDNDFSMKMWQSGCRIFLGIGASRIYHFMSRSTGKVIKNNGRKQFLKKWGITQSTFDRHYLHRGETVTNRVLPDPELSLSFGWDLFRSQVKRLLV
ncbi:MAG: glycosyltransferase [Betaproteobacteria bacterium]|jgi:Predicted glycosyltransferases|nr:glycosyltransferase [Betaproteobacteria bacterium]